MKLSKTGLRVLTEQYRSVLKKCFLINAGTFFISSAALAADVTSNLEQNLELDGDDYKVTGSEIYNFVDVKNSTMTMGEGSQILFKGETTDFPDGRHYFNMAESALDMTNATINGAPIDSVIKENNERDESKDANLSFSKSVLTLTNSDVETNGDIVFQNGTKLNYTCIDCYQQEEEEGEIFYDYENIIMGYNVRVDNSSITLGTDSQDADTKAYNDYAYIGANNSFKITNGSTINLNGSAVLAYEGHPDDKREGDTSPSLFEISGSNVNLNQSAKIAIGLKDDDDNGTNIESVARLDINNSTITLNDNASIEFFKLNPEKTNIQNSDIYMNDASSMKLNAVTLSHSQIKMTDTATMTLDSVTLDNATITGETTNTITIGGRNYTEFKDTSLVAGAGATTATGGHLVSVQAGSKFGVVAFGKEVTIDGENNDAAIYLQSGVDGTSTTDLNGENYTLTINGGILSDNVNNVVNFTGTVNFNGLFDPATAHLNGNLIREGYDDEITYNLNSGGTLKYLSDDGLNKYANNSINFNGGLLDIANGEVTGIKLSKLSLSKESNIHVDADLANKTMDTLTADTIEANAKLNIAKLNLISDATQESTAINFTKDKSLLKQVNYTGATSGLKALSPVYTYEVAYDNATGDFTFTRGGGAAATDYNPAVYGSATTSQTVGFLQQNIANAVFDNLGLQTFRPMGRASGDEPYSNHAWVSLFGADDNVEFDSFETVDSEMMSLAGGFNSDKIKLGDNYVGYGIYAGYLNGESKYTGNEIDQEGGYIGLSSSLQNGNFVMAGTINGGFIKNEAKHSFGTDKYDTYWTGVSLKTGYDYHVNNSLTIQPNVYAGYSFVNSEDYTSKSGAKIKNDNLHLFEVAPGLKVNQTFANGWNGFALGKYAFVMDNGGDTNVDSALLPNISVKDYVEYGLGVEKDIRSDWRLAATINRRDGGRQGWNGNLTVQYNF